MTMESQTSNTTRTVSNAVWLAHNALLTAVEKLSRANATTDPVAGLLTLTLIERAAILERDVLALAQAIAAREEG